MADVSSRVGAAKPGTNTPAGWFLLQGFRQCCFVSLASMFGHRQCYVSRKRNCLVDLSLVRTSKVPPVLETDSVQPTEISLGLLFVPIFILNHQIFMKFLLYPRHCARCCGDWVVTQIQSPCSLFVDLIALQGHSHFLVANTMAGEVQVPWTS